ncbi:hypothetical protein BC834DRAFT_881206 [Gloeopeniophorella convolvens]|nr:hypothetical protein BC834DRAFT_881206 [Gloeopeniophorella convolvens]
MTQCGGGTMGMLDGYLSAAAAILRWSVQALRVGIRYRSQPCRTPPDGGSGDSYPTAAPCGESQVPRAERRSRSVSALPSLCGVRSVRCAAETVGSAVCVVRNPPLVMGHMARRRAEGSEQRVCTADQHENTIGGAIAWAAGGSVIGKGSVVDSAALGY